MSEAPSKDGGVLAEQPRIFRYSLAADALLIPLERSLVALGSERGVVDLEHGALLEGRGRDLLLELQTRATAGIEAREGDSDRTFFEGLRTLGIVRCELGPPTKESGLELASNPADWNAPELTANEFLTVVRGVLGSGRRLRFRARGASMRPQIADGSVLEVAPLSDRPPRLGDILLYEMEGPRLVAHRVVGRKQGDLLLRGDSAERLDRAPPSAILGRVESILEKEPMGVVRMRWVDGAAARTVGMLTGGLHRGLVFIARTFCIAPLRRFSWLRRLNGALLRVLSGVLRRKEDLCFALRRRVDTLRAALETGEEKDRARRRLYARRAVVKFTALDENVEAGLTLIEEVLLARHPLAQGPVLVLGCGPGRECVPIARAGLDVTGVDWEPSMLVHAERLLARHGLKARFVPGDATELPKGLGSFRTVVIFSGLLNMVLPRQRRIAMLAGAAACLEPSGQILGTFLSDYVPPGVGPNAPPREALHRAINPDHEPGDRFLLNETVHIYPHPEHLALEARAAGLEVVEIHRDQRAYDKTRGQVRGFAVFRKPEVSGESR